MKQILHLVPFQNLIFFFSDIDLLFPRIQALQATFKAVLIAVYMTYGLQTKCKTCFGGTRMILHAPGLAKDHKNTVFFSEPFPYGEKVN